ncbi:MAG: L-2-hydroxyglutarate oxidase [Planctomycetota bacterium]|nr:MAG: L-2-hydroxyglutarate oxidase [Planctomycetota bacterium]
MGARTDFEITVIGGGLVGLATARALQRQGVRDLLLLEAEDRWVPHQSSHNSGVLHSGLYYRPGSWKARLCRRGRAAMERFCQEHGVAHRRCGKVVVACTEEERNRLADLVERGRANGLTGLELLDAKGVRQHEPHAGGLAGLWVPSTGVVDFSGVANRLAEQLQDQGATLRLGQPLRGVRREGSHWQLRSSGQAYRTSKLVACAGLQADRVARLCGLRPQIRIVPFRGEYFHLAAGASNKVRGLIYPVPDPRFPFLGVHFTRSVFDEVEAGPNAVPAWHRHGYRKGSFSWRDAASNLLWPGFWKLGFRYGPIAAGEVRRSYSRRASAQALRRLLPSLADRDLQPGGSGVRAQAVSRDGRLLDDFAFEEGPGMLHVFNAPSPAATACLEIGRVIAEKIDSL